MGWALFGLIFSFEKSSFGIFMAPRDAEDFEWALFMAFETVD